MAEGSMEAAMLADVTTHTPAAIKALIRAIGNVPPLIAILPCLASQVKWSMSRDISGNSGVTFCCSALIMPFEASF
jgi:hypothetical protein